jgi:cobalt-zinc-cadmium efflux system protein
MSHHGHDHGHRTAGVLRVSLLLTLGYVALLVFAGLRAHSLALLSEAGHNVSDLLALVLSSAAVYLQKRPADGARTYGYHRAEVLAAFVNAATLIVMALWIAGEALLRLLHPEPVAAGTMIWAAAAGVAMNGVIALMLLGDRHDLNLRSTLIHELGDTLSTAAVIVGGLVIWRTGVVWVDPALSLLIAAFIFWSSIGILRQSGNILLEGAPEGVALAQVLAAIGEAEGVLEVHDLHIWSLGSQSRALSAHVKIADIPPSQSEAIMGGIRQRLAERFHIHHTTIQFECNGCEVADGCVLPTHSAEECPGAGYSNGGKRGEEDGHGHSHETGCCCHHEH